MIPLGERAIVGVGSAWLSAPGQRRVARRRRERPSRRTQAGASGGGHLGMARSLGGLAGGTRSRSYSRRRSIGRWHGEAAGKAASRSAGDGRWMGQADLGWQDGKRRRKSLYGRTKGEVQSKLRETLHRKAHGMPPRPGAGDGRHLPAPVAGDQEGRGPAADVDALRTDRTCPPVAQPRSHPARPAHAAGRSRVSSPRQGVR